MKLLRRRDSIEGGERIIVCNCKTKDCIIWLLFIIII